MRLVVLPVHIDSTSPEYNPVWHAEVATLLARVDAAVHPVDNGTAGQVRFGGLTCFRHLVRHTADILTGHVLSGAAPVLILALDAPFLGLAPLLPTGVMPSLVLVSATLEDPASLAATLRRAFALTPRNGTGSARQRGGSLPTDMTTPCRQGVPETRRTVA